MANKKNKGRRGRHEGSVYQRKDGRWVGTISLGSDSNGKRKRKTVYGASKREAQQKLRQIQTQVDLGHVVEPSSLTLQEYLTRWLEHVAKPRVAPSTYDRYGLHLKKHVIPHIGAVKLTKLTSYHVEQLYAVMATEGDSDWEIQKTGKVLSQALRDAVRSKLIQFNPAAEVPRPRPKKREIQCLNLEQVKLFLTEAKKHRLYALFVTAIDTGARMGELFALRWEDVDLESGSITIRYTLEELRGYPRLKEPKTTKSRRRIQLSAHTTGVLREHRERMAKEGYASSSHPIFCDTRGGWLRRSNMIRNALKPILKRTNEKIVGLSREQGEGPKALPQIRFHDLRHTCATLLLMADENVKVVSERLGHSTIQMTLDTYSHVLPTMQQRAAEKMNGMLGGE